MAAVYGSLIFVGISGIFSFGAFVLKVIFVKADVKDLLLLI